jgi:hypothetical protein
MTGAELPHDETPEKNPSSQLCSNLNNAYLPDWIKDAAKLAFRAQQEQVSAKSEKESEASIEDLVRNIASAISKKGLSLSDALKKLRTLEDQGFDINKTLRNLDYSAEGALLSLSYDPEAPEKYLFKLVKLNNRYGTDENLLEAFLQSLNKEKFFEFASHIGSGKFEHPEHIARSFYRLIQKNDYNCEEFLNHVMSQDTAQTPGSWAHDFLIAFYNCYATKNNHYVPERFVDLLSESYRKMRNIGSSDETIALESIKKANGGESAISRFESLIEDKECKPSRRQSALRFYCKTFPEIAEDKLLQLYQDRDFGIHAVVCRELSRPERSYEAREIIFKKIKHSLRSDKYENSDFELASVWCESYGGSHKEEIERAIFNIVPLNVNLLDRIYQAACFMGCRGITGDEAEIIDRAKRISIMRDDSELLIKACQNPDSLSAQNALFLLGITYGKDAESLSNSFKFLLTTHPMNLDKSSSAAQEIIRHFGDK